MGCFFPTPGTVAYGAPAGSQSVAPWRGYFRAVARCGAASAPAVVAVLGTTAAACPFRDPHHQIYYRLWILPPVLDVGVLTADQDYVFRAWNAYKESITVTSTSVEGDPGIEVLGASPPFSMGPLVTTGFVLRVSLSGPPNIDAQVTFTATAGSASMQVKGLRAIVVEGRPDWKHPVVERHVFKTDVWVSWAGREFRRSVRAMPRLEISYTSTQWDEVAQHLTWRFDTLQDAFLLVPRWGMFVRTTALAVTGVTVVPVSSVPWWIAPGQVVVIGAGTYLITATDAGAGTITISPGLSEDVPAGERVSGTLTGRLKNSLSATWHTDEAQVAKVEVETDSGTMKVPDAPPPTTLWEGYPVFDMPFNWHDHQTVRWQSRRLTVDYGVGPKAVMNPAGRSDTILRATFYDLKRRKVEEYLAFFYAMKGRAGEFWLPTQHMDIRLARDYSPSQGFLPVAGTKLAGVMGGSPVHKAVRVVAPDGQKYLSLISSITTSGNETRVNLASPPPVAIPRNARVEFVYRARFASDGITVEWITDEVAKLTLSFLALEVV